MKAFLDQRNSTKRTFANARFIQTLSSGQQDFVRGFIPGLDGGEERSYLIKGLEIDVSNYISELFPRVTSLRFHSGIREINAISRENSSSDSDEARDSLLSLGSLVSMF